MAAPEKNAIVSSARDCKDAHEIRTVASGRHGRKRLTPGKRLLGSPSVRVGKNRSRPRRCRQSAKSQCACGEETLNHSYPRGPAGRSRVLHFSRMCLSQGEGSGIKILSSWHFPLFSSVKMKYKGQIPPEEHVGKNDACLTLITCPRQPCRYNFSHRKSISGVGSLNLFPKEYDYVLQSV